MSNRLYAIAWSANGGYLGNDPIATSESLTEIKSAASREIYELPAYEIKIITPLSKIRATSFLSAGDSVIYASHNHEHLSIMRIDGTDLDERESNDDNDPTPSAESAIETNSAQDDDDLETDYASAGYIPHISDDEMIAAVFARMSPELQAVLTDEYPGALTIESVTDESPATETEPTLDAPVPAAITPGDMIAIAKAVGQDSALYFALMPHKGAFHSGVFTKTDDRRLSSLRAMRDALTSMSEFVADLTLPTFLRGTLTLGGIVVKISLDMAQDAKRVEIRAERA